MLIAGQSEISPCQVKRAALKGGAFPPSRSKVLRGIADRRHISFTPFGRLTPYFAVGAVP